MEKDCRKLWLSNATEIGAAIGRSRYEVPNLVKNDNLPAFKFYGRWTAIPAELKRWCIGQSIQHLKQRKIKKAVKN
jgi:hypothetical protein